jgi:hypothetical protein
MKAPYAVIPQPSNISSLADEGNVEGLGLVKIPKYISACKEETSRILKV